MNSSSQDALELLHGIGPTNAEKLRLAGIETPQQLSDLGAEAAFLRIRERSDAGACLHLLLALEAAVQELPKRQLAKPRQAELRTWYETIG